MVYRSHSVGIDCRHRAMLGLHRLPSQGIWGAAHGFPAGWGGRGGARPAKQVPSSHADLPAPRPGCAKPRKGTAHLESKTPPFDRGPAQPRSRFRAPRPGRITNSAPALLGRVRRGGWRPETPGGGPPKATFACVPEETIGARAKSGIIPDFQVKEAILGTAKCAKSRKYLQFWAPGRFGTSNASIFSVRAPGPSPTHVIVRYFFGIFSVIIVQFWPAGPGNDSDCVPCRQFRSRLVRAHEGADNSWVQGAGVAPGVQRLRSCPRPHHANGNAIPSQGAGEGHIFRCDLCRQKAKESHTTTCRVTQSNAHSRLLTLASAMESLTARHNMHCMIHFGSYSARSYEHANYMRKRVWHVHRCAIIRAWKCMCCFSVAHTETLAPPPSQPLPVWQQCFDDKCSTAWQHGRFGLAFASFCLSSHGSPSGSSPSPARWALS